MPTFGPGAELLGELLDRHARALALFAKQWCDCPDDVVQDAFVQLARQTECPRDAAAWLFRAVRNGAISAGRARARRRRHEMAAAEEASEWFETAEDAAIDGQLAAEALSELPPEQREVIVAHVWGGLTFSQIAELVESTASTVHRRYQAGLAALRHLLGETCPTKPKDCRTS
jgi:RNA polymerase sigma-70 factor (ECF subfamily)